MGIESEFPIPSGRGQRCARHALAAGPEGLCALCRTESLPPPRPYPTWVLGGLLASIMLVSTGVIAYRALRDVRAVPAAIASEALPVSATTSAAEPNAAPAAALLQQPSDTSGAAVAFTAPLPPPTVAAAEPARPAPQATPQRLDVATRPTRPAPSEAELRAALSSTPVVLYATGWCGYCRKAREFLTANGFEYREIDADKTPGGWEKVQQLGGQRAVPVIVVDGEVSAGLNPDRILESAARSMERRLGITGITFRAN